MTNTSTLGRVERACAQLRRDGRNVTFTGVAAATGLRRTTLYRDPAIRAAIEEHRRRTVAGGTLAGLTEEIATLSTALDALGERVRRHEERLRRLENQQR